MFFYKIKNDDKYYLSTVIEPVTITLKAYRNDESYMQDLPSIILKKGDIFYLNNENTPSIEGFDFVCCTDNGVTVNEDIEVKVYYIPQNVPDRNRTNWSGTYLNDTSVSGDLRLTDFVNTYSGTYVGAMFYGTHITAPPKINTSLSNNFSNTFFQCPYLTTTENCYWDLSKADNMNGMFYGCGELIEFKNFFTTKVKPSDISSIFTFNTKLTYVDFSLIDTNNVTTMSASFANCTSLVTIKGVFDLSNCINITNTFSNCPLLRNVHLKNVPRSLDMSTSGGTEGVTYIIENYLEDK